MQTRYCDKDLVEALKSKFNLTVSAIEKLKGEKKDWLASFIHAYAPIPSAKELGVDARFNQEFRIDVTTDEIYEAETEILKALAAEGSCVIAGRSGFFVFKDHPNRLNVFITAPESTRIRRVMEKQDLAEKTAAALVKDIDQSRENYIRRCAGVSRYDARNYDLVISTDGHTEEQVADLILSYIG